MQPDHPSGPHKDALNIAVLGYSGIGRIHSIGYRDIPLYYPEAKIQPVLHTVVTSQETTAQAAQKEAGFLNATTDQRSAVENPEVDVVDISLPNHLHSSAIHVALKAGKFVYCEKPLGRTIQDAWETYRSVLELDGLHRFGMVFQYRFIPAILRAHQLIQEGRLGRIFTFRAEYLHSGYQNPERPLSWRLKREEGGSGALGDLGSHIIDLVRYLLGEFAALQGHLETFIPERPIARGSSQRGPVTVDDVAWIRAKMENGATGTIEASRFATGTLDDLRISVHGEKGAIKFDLMDPSFLYFFDESNPGGDYGGSRGWQRIETVGHYPNAVAPPARAPIGWIRSHGENQFRFLEAIAQGHTPVPNVLDGLCAQLVIDATERSAAEGGRWIDLKQVEHPPLEKL